MKQIKLSVILVFCCFLTAPALAQEAFGLFAGFNFTNLSRSPGLAGTSHSQSSRFAFGALVDFKLFGDLELRLEPMFVRKGAIFDFTDPSNETQPDQRFTKNYDYFETPAMLKYNLFSEKEPVFLLAGPSFAIPISLKHNSRAETVDAGDELSGFDFGATVGAGITLKATNANFFLEGRFNVGLKNINASDDDSFSLKNNGFRVLFGLQFPLGK